MHDSRRMLDKMTEKPRVKLDAVTRRLLERDELDIFTLDPGAENRIAARQRNDLMTKQIHVHSVNQVHDAVFKSSDVKAIDDVHHKWTTSLHLVLISIA